MPTNTFQLTSEYIELIKLLKLMQLASSGGDAKMIVENGSIRLNGMVELRKRAKLHKGDTIEFEDVTIKLI